MRIKGLDGIRGLAILLVVTFHYGYAPFGWIGVQIFFVLSGFLITSILLSTTDMPFSAYIRRFYWRRSLRIFPLYFAMLFAATAAYLIWRGPSRFLEDLPYLATYTTNFGRLRQTDIDQSFVHLWSLAVEEQFYLIWPFFIFFTPRVELKKVISAIIVCGPILRFAAYLYFREDPEIVGRAIYSLPTSQFDAFAFGAALAVFEIHMLKNIGQLFTFSLLAMGAAGASTIFYMHFLAGGAFKGSLGFQMYLMPAYGFVWGYSLLNLISMFGIAYVLRNMSLAQLFERTGPVFVGKISYGMYVIHVPVLSIMAAYSHNQGPLNFIVYLFVVLALATASFRWLETPFLRLKERSVFKRPSLMAPPG
jgi:peptidoglycan/LPS O-acetylase OafA/YrhL